MKQTNVHRITCFGESLWVALAGGAEAGGTPVAIARNLKRLGAEPALITRVGIDDEGRRLIGAMETELISTDHFQLDYAIPTGLLHAMPDNLALTGTSEAWHNITWDISFGQLADETTFFVHSHLPTRSEVCRKTLFDFFEARLRRVFCMQLHGSPANKDIIGRCLQDAYLFITNPADLELITGWFAPLYTIRERMQVLQDRFHIPYVIIAEADGGCLLNAEGTFYRHPGFKDEQMNPFSADDAFVAALLYQFCEGADPQSAIEYACALKALVRSAYGGCPSYDHAQIEQLIHQSK